MARRSGKIGALRTSVRNVVARSTEHLGHFPEAAERILMRRRTERLLTESKEHLHTVVANVPVVLFAADRKGVITLSEGQGLKALGLKPGKIVGQSIFDVYRDAPQILGSFHRALAGETFSVAVEVAGLTFETWYSPLWAKNGEVAGVTGVAVNITERKREEEETKEANRHLEELAALRADFTAMVAHEIASPLATIRGFLDVLETGELNPAEQADALAKIQAETDRLSTLVADVRSAAAIEREEFTLVPRRISVDELLEDAARFAETLPGDHPLIVEVDTEERVWADRYRIGQVLRNLLSNAAKYSPNEAPINLRALRGETPDRVRIEVADRGYGVHPDDVDRIFEKFSRGRSGDDRKAYGVGLGLYLSRRIVRAHGGDLTLTPAPGGGSVFGFELEAVR